jgi:hypothetical protein
MAFFPFPSLGFPAQGLPNHVTLKPCRNSYSAFLFVDREKNGSQNPH